MWRLANAGPRGCREPLVFVPHRRAAVHLLLRSKPVGCALVKKPVVEKYRRFTGRQGAPNTGKVIEIAKEKADGKKQGAEQGKQAEIRAHADASPGHVDTPQ